MDFFVSAILNAVTFLLTIVFTFCVTVWMCSNKKSSTEKTNPKSKKNGEKVIVVPEGLPTPEIPMMKSQPQKAAAAATTTTTGMPNPPPQKQQKKTLSAEPDAKQHNLSYLSSAENVEEVKFKSEPDLTKTKTPATAAKRKTQPTESTDLKTPDWMLPPPPQDNKVDVR